MIHDLIVIGGGIHGAAVARDAALRGLGVLLLEARDLAWGTSSRTSKLIHGGIRYLESGELGLVREALRERAILLEIAPAYVRPLPFLVPHYRGEGRARLEVRLGLALYALLAGRHRLAAHRTVGPTEALALEPGLRRSGLIGASTYWDAQMEDARLCVAIAVGAEAAGASVRTYAPVRTITREGGSWTVRYEDEDAGPLEARARCVVNAAGPWAEEVRRIAGGSGPRRLRRTRGAHVVLTAPVDRHALLLTAGADGRVVFVLPWGGPVLVGTTDTDDDAPPESVGPSPGDIRYLIAEAARALPGLARAQRPLRAFAGVRSLTRSGAVLPWQNPREHRIVEEEAFMTLIGGKYTTHRSLAERVVNRIVRRLGRRAAPCRTASTPVADRDTAIAALATAHPGRLDLGSALSLSQAEVVQAVRHERAAHLEDVLLRRTRLWIDRGALRRAAEPAAGWMAPLRGWSEGERAREIAAVLGVLDAEERAVDAALDGSTAR